MVFYHLLHNVLPETDRFKDGKRNCCTFIYGSALYAVVYVLFCNLKLYHGVALEPICRALFLVWMADVATMSYVYKSYYGRSILHEVSSDDQRNWVYDEVTHKYRIPTPAEIESKRQEENARIERVKRHREIVLNKSRINAARIIQRWWRAKLYNPPNGILYLRAKDRFYACANENNTSSPQEC